MVEHSLFSVKTLRIRRAFTLKVHVSFACFLLRKTSRNFLFNVVNWSLQWKETQVSRGALLCMSSKMAATIALLLLFVMKNKPGLWRVGQGAFFHSPASRFLFFVTVFPLIPFTVLLCVSFSFIIQFCSLPSLSHFTKHGFFFIFLSFFLSLLQIVSSHLSLSFISLFFSFSRSRRRGFVCKV